MRSLWANLSNSNLPLVRAARALSEDRDVVARVLLTVIALYAMCVLALPFSRDLQVLGLQRFHLVHWRYGPWAVFQPLPSMYNFENHIRVSFTSGRVGDAACPATDNVINHHVFNSILLRRVELERCGLPATARLASDYRQTHLVTTFLISPRSEGHGLVVREIR